MACCPTQVTKYHSTRPVAYYLIGVTLLALLAIFTTKDRTGLRLDKDAPDMPQL